MADRDDGFGHAGGGPARSRAGHGRGRPGAAGGAARGRSAARTPRPQFIPPNGLGFECPPRPIRRGLRGPGLRRARRPAGAARLPLLEAMAELGAAVPAVQQLAMADLIARGGYDRHIRRMRLAYRRADHRVRHSPATRLVPGAGGAGRSGTANLSLSGLRYWTGRRLAWWA